MWQLDDYPLVEEIGNPELFVGREQEMTRLLKWAEEAKRLQSKSMGILSRRKKGKTALDRAIPEMASRRVHRRRDRAGERDGDRRGLQLERKARQRAAGAARLTVAMLESGGDGEGSRCAVA